MNETPHQIDTSELDAEDSKPDGWIDRAFSRVRTQVRRRPLQAVGGAFAVGFMVGNNLPGSVSKTIFATGLRLMVARALARWREQHQHQS
jgi:hypothetical protein